MQNVSPSPITQAQSSSFHGGDDAQAFSELTKILNQNERARIERLEKRMNNFRLRPEDVSPILPEAIAQAASQSQKLSSSLTSTVQDTLDCLFKQRPQIFVDALFPIIGPTIRKSIASSFNAMIENITQSVEHTFTLEGLRWRWQAWRTGRPYAEVALSHTLLYRVDQIFLIHRKSGILLQHVTSEHADERDPQLVSSMLTAIQDFVRDSFGSGQGNSLDSFRVGELVIQVEQSPSAILAAVIRGTVTPELHSLLQRTLEQIYYDYRIALLDFDGDTTAFQGTRPLLEACLKKEKKAPSRRFHWIVLFVFLMLISILGYWVYKQYQHQQVTALKEIRWHEFIQEAGSLPGVVITHTHFKDDHYSLSGLKDPNALDPLLIAPKFNIDPKKIETRWKQILSLEPELIYERALAYLSPPDGVTLKLADNILIATGKAHHRWIQDAKARWTTINGIQQFHTDNLTNIELKEFDDLVQKIEALNIFFDPSQSIPINGQEEVIQKVILYLKKINPLAETLQRQISLEILGHTDPTGAREMNDNLSLTRANKVMSLLVLEEPPPVMLTPLGVGSSLPILSPQAMQDPNASPRRVSFRLKWSQSEP
jgi:outer membrane protein OmpA-like peptidoglycan-associated protein